MKRRAVHGNERPVCARARVVDGAGYQLLAGPALAGDQHGRLGWGHLRSSGECLAERGGATNDLVEPVSLVELGTSALEASLQRLRAALERGNLHTLVNRIQEVFIVEGFRQKVRGACFQGAHGHRDVAVACQENNGDLKIRFGKLLLQVESADPGQRHIQDQTTWCLGSRGSQELLR